MMVLEMAGMHNLKSVASIAESSSNRAVADNARRKR